MRRTHPQTCLFVIFALVGSTVPATYGQNPASADYVPTMTFDVASIRESPPADSYRVGGYFAPHSTSFSITNMSMSNLISMAYNVRRDQIVGLPDSRAMYNIQAKSDSASEERIAKLTPAQSRLEEQHMLQTLLADRFKLQVHPEDREGPTFNLVIVKGGLKMQDAKDTKEIPRTPEEIKAWGDRAFPPLYQRGSSRVGFDYVAHSCSISDMVGMLASQTGRPVTDKTNLTGTYTFVLHYHGTRLSDRSADDLDPVPPLDVAIQEQLGLKLEPAKGAVRVLVVDHVEKPSEN